MAATHDTIVRRVKVDRTKTPQEILDATGCTQYTNREVVYAMPRGEGDEAEICFFKVGRNISDSDLEKQYDLRGLKPADPCSLAQTNTDDPAFADTHPNATHWKDANGEWCFVLFNRWRGKRDVIVYRNDEHYGWNGDWWFAGVRK